MHRVPRPSPLVAILLAVALAGAAEKTGAETTRERLAAALAAIPPAEIPSGILRDRVLPLAPLERFDGTAGAPAATLRDWRQALHEFRGASLVPPAWPEPDLSGPAVPIGILNLRYERLRADAMESGALVLSGGRLVRGDLARPLVSSHELFLAAALRPHDYRAGRVLFRLGGDAYISNDSRRIAGMRADFDDGRGVVPLTLEEGGALEEVSYTSAGMKTIRVEVTLDDGSILRAAATFDARAMAAPTPDDTLRIIAGIPYNGQVQSGDAYVYLAPGHQSVVEPVVVIEGFDLDNTMNWDELYALLNQENLLEDLRAQGFDAVVLNFTDAVDYIQRNAFVAVELIQEIQVAIGPTRTLAVVGASMGGLVGRYALAYMEQNGLPHKVRTFLSFDSPQVGANIPLGIQYWLSFFADDAAEAAALLAALDTPGARQMLAYHHTNPPGATGQPDPLRAALLADFAAVGEYPAEPRKVSIINGSGNQVGQGFNAGDQIVRWEYTSFLVDVTGNVWAVPDTITRTIFHGLIDVILFPADEQVVNVSVTDPFDNAPGGWRDSMAQMDAVSAPYGDIVALHPNHCFIPSISALGLDTQELFYDISGDPNLLDHTSFDAVYFPSPNQDHVAITAENKQWFLNEVRAGANDVAAGEPALRIARIDRVRPNPASERAEVAFTMPHAGRATLSLHDVAGRRLAVLADREFQPGRAEVAWERGVELAPGVYFLELEGADFAASGRLVVQ